MEMDLNAMKKALNGAIDKGNFVPFLGAASPSIRKHNIKSSEKEKIWGVVFDRLQKLQKKVLLVHGDVYYDKSYRFLKDLANDHEITLVKEIENITIKEDDHLLNFQFSIFVFLLWCADKVADRIKNNALLPESLSDPVIDFKDLSDKERDYLEFEILIKSIIDSLKVLDNAIEESSNDVHVLLPLHKILENLQFFVCKVFCENPLENNDQYQINGFENHLICENCRKGKSSSKRISKVITLAEVKWLKELLWWSSRYDVPIYPTSSELAHYMSYYLDVPPIADIRDYDLSLVAGAISKGPEILSKLFKTIENKRELLYKSKSVETAEISRDIFSLIAKYLVNYKKYSDNEKDIPIAVTTNYDSMMEKEIEGELKRNNKENRNYRVVFPVWIDNNSNNILDGEEIVEKIFWIHSTIDVNNNGEDNDINYSFTDDLKNLFKAESSSQIPTLIKIHGAPCLNIKTVKKSLKFNLKKDQSDYKEQINRIDGMKHFVILSESNYLNSLPIFMGKDQVNEAIFNSGKSIWFLGYSVSDWDVRVMMLQGMKERVDTNSPKGEIKDTFGDTINENIHQDSFQTGAKYYIFKPGGFDNYRENIFNALKETIYPIPERLEYFHNYLKEILEKA